MYTLLLLVACSAETDATEKAAPDPCERGTLELGWEDPTDFGPPSEIAARAAFTQEVDFTYADGTVTGLSIAVEADLDGTPSGATALGDDASCFGRRITVPMRLTFATDDGAFAEDTVLDTVAGDDGEGFSGQPTLAADEHVGTYDMSGWEAVDLAFVSWGEDSAGEVVLIRDGLDGECGVGAWNLALMTGCPTR